MWWNEPITVLKGIGIKKALDFEKIGVKTLGDLVNRYPRFDSYIDYSKLKTINELNTNNEKQIFSAEIVNIREAKSHFGKKYSRVVVKDTTGFAEIYLFFNQRYQIKGLQAGQRVLVTGKVRKGVTAKNITEATLQRFEDDKIETLLGIVPVYSLTGSLTQNNIRNAVQQVLAKAENYLPESLPMSILKKKKLLNRYEAIKNIHFPGSFALLKAAKARLVFEELYLLQCGLLYYRSQIKENKAGISHQPQLTFIEKVKAGLPFALTQAQAKAWQEISTDMHADKPMHRLLQGDVGSGKTVVSALALALAVANGYQGCIMVPTEILANQHFLTMQEYLTDVGIKIELLTSSVKGSKRKEILDQLATGEIDVLVGTHALIQDEVQFSSLALVITDEQHRFGVEQRAKLTNKSSFSPDILIMTATPIPRTLALTVYGDLDVSIMRGLPPGRKPIDTLCYTDEKRHEIYAGVARQVAEGHQAYVVCPLIEESGTLEIKSATEIYEELVKTDLKGINCGLLHGKMKPREKESIMEAFVSGEIKVLIATTVIEVGVNVPNASLMVIEGADRFGLAQMHQLRGRVGRGSSKSFCVLLTNSHNPLTLERLEIMRHTSDGFLLAEKDLELRGAGQLFGLRQHGLPDLYIADILRDTEVLLEARELAKASLEDSNIFQEVETSLKNQFDERFQRIFYS